MQLSCGRMLRGAALVAAIALLSAAHARAQVPAPPFQLGMGTTAFHESGGPLHMTVLTPEVDAQVQPTEGLGVHAE
jgi:Spy/CpxP family protein refolding chaperone